MGSYVSAKKVLKQLQWDSNFVDKQFSLVFIDRGTRTNTSTINCKDVSLYPCTFGVQKRNPDTWAYEQAEIPYHRIIKIFNTVTNEILFSKKPPITSGVKTEI